MRELFKSFFYLGEPGDFWISRYNLVIQIAVFLLVAFLGISLVAWTLHSLLIVWAMFMNRSNYKSNIVENEKYK